MDGISPIAATLISVFTAAIGVLAGYLIRKSIAEAKISSAEEEAARILEEAQKQAEAKKRESLVEAREEVHKMRAEFERELRNVASNCSGWKGAYFRKRNYSIVRANNWRRKRTRWKGARER